MRAVLQRVSAASVKIDGSIHSSIKNGLLILLGIGPDDSPEDGEWLAQKLCRLRIFSDAEGQMNRSVGDIGGSILVVSQFTLFASTRKGTRPSFNDAARPEIAIPLYEGFLNQLRQAGGGTPVHAGVFGAMMEVSLTNDGPVTLLIDSKKRE